jgi:hypothetical protein
MLKPSEMPSYIADILNRVWCPPVNVELDPADDKYYKNGASLSTKHLTALSLNSNGSY